MWLCETPVRLAEVTQNDRIYLLSSQFDMKLLIVRQNEIAASRRRHDPGIRQTKPLKPSLKDDFRRYDVFLLQDLNRPSEVSIERKACVVGQLPPEITHLGQNAGGCHDHSESGDASGNPLIIKF